MIRIATIVGLVILAVVSLVALSGYLRVPDFQRSMQEKGELSYVPTPSPKRSMGAKAVGDGQPCQIVGSERATGGSWRVYADRERRFSIRLPRDYFAEVDKELDFGAGPTVVIKPIREGFSISIATMPQKQDVRVRGSRWLFGLGPLIKYERLPENVAVKTVCWDGVEAFRVDHCCGGYDGVEAEIKTVIENTLYEVVVTPDEYYLDKVGKNGQRDQVEEMLSTFRFSD